MHAILKFDRKIGVKVENLREKLYSSIDKWGLDHKKVINANKELHEEINKNQISMIKGAK